MVLKVRNLIRRINAKLSRYLINQSIINYSRSISLSKESVSSNPVIFFNASTRIEGLSLNAAFSLLSAWALKKRGVSVMHYVCERGMRRCVLGTDRHNLDQKLPCDRCISQSKILFNKNDVFTFHYKQDETLYGIIQDMTVENLMKFNYQDVPLGSLVLPSVRWILRRHNLQNDQITSEVLRDYILSAWSMKNDFEKVIKATNPKCVVVFNGMMYPEATVRWIANQLGIPSYSHEVGISPYSAFFTAGEATAYPVTIPDDFQLNDEQDKKLDAYLNKRFEGKFTMAGQEFWPEMSSLDPAFKKYISKFKQIVPVFTNVIFDTSQPHANVVFTDMFEWLDTVVEIAKNYPATLFIIRAHPDETRPGKKSEESVADWVKRRKISKISNMMFISPDKYFSSYEIIERGKFVMIYNSTIGLEASIMGKPVLCAGRARFTQLETVFFPQTIKQYLSQANEFIEAEKITVPNLFKYNSRRFLYFQLYKTSLSFSQFIEDDDIWRGYVKLKNFEPDDLLPDNSPAMKAIYDGLFNQGDFLIP